MAGLQARIASSWKPITGLSVFHLGAWRRLKTLKTYIGGEWKLVANFAPPMSASVSPDVLAAVGHGKPFATVISPAATCTPVGGQAPYTYQWIQTSGLDATILSAVSASSNFQMAVNQGDSNNAAFAVTVTDANGTIATADCLVQFNNIS